jgi:hypothetical protein
MADMEDMFGDINSDSLGILGVTSEEDRIAEHDEKAADEAARRAAEARAAAPAVVEPAKAARRSKVRESIEAIQGAPLETATEALARQADAISKSAEPVVRPNGQLYYPRLLAGKSDVTVLRDFRQSGVPMLLGGYPGCGKTSLVEGALPDLVTVAGHNEMEMSELIGRYVPRVTTNGIVYEWVDGPLVVAMKEGRVLFLDDVTLIPAGVLARLYPAMDGRGVITVEEHEGESIEASEGFYVIGAHNPGAPGAVLSEALASRFALHLDVPTDFEMALRDLKIDRVAVNLAKELTKLRDEKGDLSWAPAMRELIAYQKIKDLLGSEAALCNLISQAPVIDRPIVEAEVSKIASVTQAKPIALGNRI